MLNAESFFCYPFSSTDVIINIFYILVRVRCTKDVVKYDTKVHLMSAVVEVVRYRVREPRMVPPTVGGKQIKCTNANGDRPRGTAFCG